MPCHANLLKVVTDVLEHPKGASFNELKKVITDFDEKDCHKSKVERVLKHFREACKLTIKVRGYRYFLERNDNLQRFYSATVGANLAELFMVNAGEDHIIDLGSFVFGNYVTCMNEVLAGAVLPRFVWRTSSGCLLDKPNLRIVFRDFLRRLVSELTFSIRKY